VFLAATKEHPLLFRERIKGSTRLVIHGRVLRDDCTPVSDAEVDVWQADAAGTYGGISSAHDYHCRGYVTTNATGHYSFTTEQPGSYGSTRVWFGSSLIPDAPPYGPRHIHIAVYHPQLRFTIFQLYMENDPAREFDWRAILAPNPDALRSLDPNCTVHVVNGKGEFNFVVPSLGAGERGFSSRREAALAYCVSDAHFEPPMPGLCGSPVLRELLRPETFYIVLLLWLAGASMVCKVCFCGRSSSKEKQQ